MMIADHNTNTMLLIPRNEIQLNDLLSERFVQCTKCATVTSDSVLLPCLHSLCRTCAPSVDACPQCSQPLNKSSSSSGSSNAAVANVFLGGLHKLIECHSDNAHCCEYCKYDGKSKSATHRCAECGDSLCEVCADAHKKTKVTRSHTILPFTEIKVGKHDELIRYRQKPLCPLHREEQISHYCEACHLVICRECQQQDHDSHPYLTLEEAAQLSRESMDADVQCVKDQMPYLSECRDILKEYEEHLETSNASLKERVEQFIHELHIMLDKYKDRLLHQLQDTMERETETVTSKSQRLNHLLHCMSSTCYFVDALLKHGRNDEIVPLCDAVRKRMRYFITMDFDALPDKLQVQFTPGLNSEKAIEQLVGRLSLRSSPRQPMTQPRAAQSHGHLPGARTPSSYRGGGSPFSATGGVSDDQESLYAFDGGRESGHPEPSERDNDNESVVSMSYSTRSRRSNAPLTAAATAAMGHHHQQQQHHHHHHHNYQEHHADRNKTTRASSFVPKSLSSLPPVDAQVTLLLEFEARSSTDMRDIWPTGVALNPVNGDIFVLDRDNKCVKIFTQEGVFKSQFGGKESNELGRLGCPYDIAISSLGVVYVTDYLQEQVKCYSLSGEFQSSFGKGQLKHPRGVCITAGGRVAVADCRLRQVIVHEPLSVAEAGRSVHTVGGADLFTDPYYVCATVDGCLLVTDWTPPHLKIFDPEGGLIVQTGVGGTTAASHLISATAHSHSHQSHHLDPGHDMSMLQPYGVCADENGYIMLADNVNHRVHLLAPNGAHLRHLITKTDGLWHPMAITVDNQHSQVVITEALGKVKVFRYK